MLSKGTKYFMIGAFNNLSAAQYHNIYAREAVSFQTKTLSGKAFYAIPIHSTLGVFLGYR